MVRLLLIVLVVWIDDALPTGALQYGQWNWVSVDPEPISGTMAHQSIL